ncbi:hypothetical protein C7S17_2847 [Burkholderia thailandensis]|nr:hypothetical protein [Burkholderia thailandensis]
MAARVFRVVGAGFRDTKRPFISIIGLEMRRKKKSPDESGLYLF